MLGSFDGLTLEGVAEGTIGGLPSSPVGLADIVGIAEIT
jgi:hypothetical protein